MTDGQGERRRRTRRALLAGSLFLICLLAAIVAITWHPDTNAIRNRFSEHGLPTSLDELGAIYKPVPRDENAAFLYLRAANLVTPVDDSKNRVVYTIAGSPVRNHAPLIDPLELGAIHDYLATNEAALSLAEQATGLNSAHFPWEFQVFENELFLTEKPISKINTILDLLVLKGVAAGQAKDAEAATQAFVDAFAVVRTVGSIPSSRIQVWRVVIFKAILDNIARSLSLNQFSEAELTRIHDAAQDALEPDPADAAFAALSAAINDPDALAVGAWWQTDMRKYVWATHLLDGLVTAYKDGPRAMHLELSRYYEEPGESVGLLEYFGMWPDFRPYPKWHPSMNMLVASHSYRHLFELMVAIERFRMDEGELPADLSTLTPRYLNELRSDPYSGASYRYLRENPGYIVYSVGPNGKDDRGQWNWQDPLDYVLRVNR